MATDYDAWLQRDEEATRSPEACIKREVLGEPVDLETGWTLEEIEGLRAAAKANRKEDPELWKR